MKNFAGLLKKGAGAAALLLVMPSVAYSGASQHSEGSQHLTNSVHKVSHSLATTVKYSSAPNYKWGSQQKLTTTETSNWARNESGHQSYKWSSADTDLRAGKSANSFAGDASYSWGAQSFAGQAGYKWGFRSYADQAGYKWGFRSYADQAGYKWGFR